jgi:hypothetical protein
MRFRIESGMTGVLWKPANLRVVLNLIQDLIRAGSDEIPDRVRNDR